MALGLVALWVLTIALGFVLVAAYAAMGHIHLEHDEGIRALLTEDGPWLGHPLPAFEGTTPDGAAVSNDDFRGRPWVLLLGSPGCAACEHFFPSIEKTWRGLGRPEEFVFLMDASPEEAQRAVRRYRLTGTVVLDPGGDIRQAIGVERTPYGFLVSADGRIIMKGVVNDRMMLESLIEERGHADASISWQ